MASVHGTWNMEKIENSSLKIGKAKPVTKIENFVDGWIFKDDNSFQSTNYTGAWAQKGSSFNISIDPEQVRIFIENDFLLRGTPATAMIKKLRIYGSEKKDWTLKGNYEIIADLVFSDLSTGKLNIKGSFTGTLPYDTAEYSPLSQGDTWTTREIEQKGEEVHENIDTKVISGTEKIKGVVATKILEPGSGYYDLMTNTSGIMLYKTYDPTFEDDVLVEETIITYNPPLMYVPPRLSVGTRYSFKTTVTSKSTLGSKAIINGTHKMIVEGIEDVTVAAGTFDDCLRIKFIDSMTVKGTKQKESSETTIWLAKGVGTVKSTQTEIHFVDDIEVERDISTKEILSATVGGVNYPSSIIPAVNYFPLEVGNKWIYSSFIQGQYRHDEIIGTEIINGSATYIKERIEPSPDNYDEKRWLGYDSSSVLIFRIWSNEGADPAIDFSPPVIENKLSPQVGDKWSFGIPNLGKMTYKVLSINDTVTVPAGTFSNCLKIMDTATPSGKIHLKHYAPEIGMIRNEQPGEWVEDLVYAKIGANTYGVIP